MRLGEIITGVLGHDLERCTLFGRQGYTGPRPPQGRFRLGAPEQFVCNVHRCSHTGI